MLGTDELTQEYLRVVNSVKPAYAFYENVYAEPLVNSLKKRGSKLRKPILVNTSRNIEKD
jgi:hypothetical protein